MAKARTARIDDGLDMMVDEYVQASRVKVDQLVNLAVKRCFSDPDVVEVVPVDRKKWEEARKKTFVKHKKTMDDLG